MALNLSPIPSFNSANPLQLGGNAEDGGGDDSGSNLGAYAVIAAALLGGLGQKDTNEKNLQIAREQMGFQERMSNTGYQRAVKDMTAAGLNPMLAYQQGGATTPAGSTATMQNVLGAGVNTALQAAQTTAQIENMEAQTNKTKSETLDNKVAIARQLWDLDRAKYDTNSARSNMALKKAEAETALEVLREMLSAEGGRTGFQADVDRRKAESKLRQFETIGAKNVADWEKTIGESSPVVKLILQFLSAWKGQSFGK